ncbi:MAG: enoyl-CoA hydratase/isomerase family protein [Alphaproteobacteria bacterium]|nr:enoyl-CoA hydratase/isomerase family protein [Alphaproteobacteria bacterium]
MTQFILTDTRGQTAIITLNRPEVLNAWHTEMRNELRTALKAFNQNPEIGAIILTGTGDRAFSAGQDLNETKTFDPDRAEAWIGEWRELYGTIRGLTKPLIAALNGLAAGSAFQVALLCDIRIGHEGVTMGQPEINSGIASNLGPWIMREHLGLSRMVELTLSGRMMSATECASYGLIHRMVTPGLVMVEALKLAAELAEKPPVAMRLTKRWFAEMTQAGFDEAMDAGVRNQRESYGTDEPVRMMEAFLARRK